MSISNEVNQQEAAKMFRVDRTSIHAWQKLGMPFISNGKGKPNSYKVGVVIHWRHGRDCFDNLIKWGKVNKHEVSVARCLVLGRIMATEPDENVTKEDINLILKLCQDAKIGKNEAFLALGYCVLAAQYFKNPPIIDEALLRSFY